MFKFYYKSPFCYLLIQSEGEFLQSVKFCQQKGNEEDMCALLREVKRELDFYFSGRLRNFSVPLKFSAGAFETKVYEALRQIPYGTTKTYKEVAELIAHPKAFRAVGNANAKNVLPIFIPCHRVVASCGLGGYSGGLEVKKFLLKSEGVKL